MPMEFVARRPWGDSRLVGEEATLGKGGLASWGKKMLLWDLKGLRRAGRQR